MANPRPGFLDSDSDSDSSHVLQQQPQASHSRPRDVLIFDHLVPPKNSEEGSFLHSHYVPPWTDPRWQDDGPDRAQSNWPIKNGVLDRVRPALLVGDQPSNPTPYAQRFGTFPGRSDGRSRTSPTRSHSRRLLLDETVQTGKQLFEHLEQSTFGRLEDYMASERPDLKALDDTEQRYMQAYQELILDEQWQGILFAYLTMDELIAGNHFAMADADFTLNGPINPLFERHIWRETKFDGAQEDRPRFLYNLEGKRQEFDPRKNDEVWKAIQPALQLATRFFEADDPFLTAFRDVTNRTKVDDQFDQRKQTDKDTMPKFKFSRNLNIFDRGYPKVARDLRNKAGFDPRRMTWTVLKRVFTIQVFSTHWDPNTGDFVGEGPVGYTQWNGKFGKDCVITVLIPIEFIWVLMADRFSKSEKMMASYVLAVTLAHEMMHAWSYASYQWLYEPLQCGITDPATVDLCLDLSLELAPIGVFSEPHFEDDPMTEAGFAFERHVLGALSWPFGSACELFARPPFMWEYPILACLSRWPDGRKPDNVTLSSYPIRSEEYYSYAKIDQIQRCFRQEFWDNSVRKFGMAAIREPSKVPSLCTFCPETANNAVRKFCSSNFSTPEDRKWIHLYTQKLSQKGLTTLDAYVTSLVTESCRFDLMAKRFMEDLPEWNANYAKIMSLLTELQLIITEYRTSYCLTRYLQTDANAQTIIRQEHQTWVALIQRCAFIPDHRSLQCIGNLEAFKTACRHSDAHHEQRLVPKLMELALVLDDELMFQESLASELYNLLPDYRRHYVNKFPGHRDAWILRALTINSQLRHLLGKMSDGQVGANLPLWPEWEARMSSIATRFQTIGDLAGADPDLIYDEWRDKLVTIPILRKSHRRPWEKWYFLAKKEMLNLEGEDLKDLKEFKTRFQDLLALGLYKIVLPDGDPDMQGLAQLWAGLLDDAIETHQAGEELNKIFKMDAVKELTEKLEAEKNKAEAANLKRAEAQASQTLAESAQAQSGQAPNIPPQITRPEIQNHPVPLSGLSASHYGTPRFGEPGQLGISAAGASPLSGLNVSTYDVFSLIENPFPTSGGESALSAPQLAAQVHQTFGNLPPPTGPAPTILPHPYAIRETITKDIQNIASAQIPLPPPYTSFPNQPHREGSGANPVRGAVGKGGLGNLDHRWDNQTRAQEAHIKFHEIAQSVMEGRIDEAKTQLEDARVRAHELAEEERRLQQQNSSNDDMDVDDASAMRAIVETDSEDGTSSVSSSEVEEIKRLGESGATTPFESPQSSEVRSECDSETDDTSSRGSQGSKRRFSEMEPELKSSQNKQAKSGFMDWWESRVIKKAKTSR